MVLKAWKKKKLCQVTFKYMMILIQHATSFYGL